jgi:hypothetical protein
MVGALSSVENQIQTGYSLHPHRLPVLRILLELRTTLFGIGAPLSGRGGAKVSSRIFKAYGRRHHDAPKGLPCLKGLLYSVSATLLLGYRR